ncbi:hypothetical protein ACTJJ0_19225 [Chitinophaga sp. 22321]|uniref:Uncharacterized protein n=1 Tax=Chitinophaga hostae TaxID=2831022 RepID=A0ABS5IX61_9BACT|nr:hypothetical protein [Chitinophaga hostae]MBS0027381.1 hypothetical protein [Chitinophaga hostae]
MGIQERVLQVGKPWSGQGYSGHTDWQIIHRYCICRGIQDQRVLLAGKFSWGTAGSAWAAAYNGRARELLAAANTGGHHSREMP